MLGQSWKGILKCPWRGCWGTGLLFFLFTSQLPLGWAVSSDMAPVVMSLSVTGPKATLPAADKLKSAVINCSSFKVALSLDIYSSNRKLTKTDRDCSCAGAGSQVNWFQSPSNKQTKKIVDKTPGWWMVWNVLINSIAHLWPVTSILAKQNGLF